MGAWPIIRTVGHGIYRIRSSVVGAPLSRRQIAAIRAERELERTCEGMAALFAVENRTERISRRELYRRCARIGERVIDVSERVVYAVVKES